MSRYSPGRTRGVEFRKIYYRLKELHMLTTADIRVSDSFSSNMLTLLLVDLPMDCSEFLVVSKGS